MLHADRSMISRVVRRVFFAAAVEVSKDVISGHNYILEAHVEGPVAPDTGMIISIRKLDALLSEITQGLDHKFLNRDVSAFLGVVPSAENISRYCYDSLTLKLQDWPQLHLHKVRLYETDDLWVDYGPHIQPEI